VIKHIPLVAAVLAAVACGAAPAARTVAAPRPAAPSAPSPESLAALLGCQVTGPDTSQQDAYDTLAYDGLSMPGDPAAPCQVGQGQAAAVITFASQARETDWLHQNDLANAGRFAQGYVGLVVGPLWVVPDEGGVVGLGSLAGALAPAGGRQVTSF
jgi:hypothetical protein